MKSEICQKILERIRKEKPNFNKLAKGVVFKNVAHQKAVQVYSFELLEQEIIRLLKFEKFENTAKKLLELIRKRDVPAILKVFEILDPQLEDYCASIRENENKAEEEIIELKPGVCGCTVNLKAIWRIILKKLS